MLCNVRLLKFQEDGKLYIFLEYVTEGSLVSVYRNFELRDTHVSAYTRQILRGLKYLHERNIIHRQGEGNLISVMS